MLKAVSPAYLLLRACRRVSVPRGSAGAAPLLQQSAARHQQQTPPACTAGLTPAVEYQNGLLG
jgi:hypothetical protein